MVILFTTRNFSIIYMPRGREFALAAYICFFAKRRVFCILDLFYIVLEQNNLKIIAIDIDKCYSV